MKGKKTLVLGASLKSDRYSNLAIHRLVHYDQEVVAIGLRSGEVAGITIHTSPSKFDDIHTVTLYLNPNRQKQYYDYIVGLHPERVIFNPGTENQEFYDVLQEAGIDIEVACTLVLLSTNQY